MKKFKKILTMCLALMMVLTCVPAAFAAEVDDCTIDEDAKASLTIWKFDWTNAYKDGVWNEDSFISTGWRESYVEEVLGETVREGDANGNPDHPLGNGQNSNGYALKGVEFTILRVADIVTFTESTNDQHPDYNLTQVLYAFDKDKAADLLTAIGLGDGAGRYENADVLNYETSAPLAPVDAEAGVDAQAIAQVRNCWYYQSDVLNKALADALEANATTVKDALEAYVAANNEAIVMDKTNENGKTIKRDLDLGLWLCIESAVPEMITSTTSPFFISLPMTTVSGDANSASPEGGHFWNYDVVVYPKNNTGIPSLTKEVRESVKDTGTNGGTDDINDGFAHAATGSAGDVMEFQILAGIPTITSNATSIQTWNFYDTIDQGLTYNKALKDVKIEIFSDEECTDKVATWLQDDGKFTVTYSSDDRHMTIDITEAGLAEINGNQENVNGKLFASYSNYTMRVTYTATINSNATVIYGENGNKNEVVLTWKRTSSDYYDTLIDDAHIFTFGVDLTKLFSDLDSESATEMDMFKHVKFRIRNTTDGYWLTAILPDNIVTRNGDTLEEDWPFFDENDPVNTYNPLYVDAVVSNPPYSQAWNPADKLAKDRGYFVSKTYYEVVSGESIAARPEIQKLLDEVSAGIYAGVLVVDLERLARGNGADQGYISQVFQYSGTKIITPAKTYDPCNEFDEEYFEFGLFMSRREYKTINRRLIRGRDSSASEGKWISSMAPYGYKRVKIEGEKGYTLEIVPEEGQWVQKVFELYSQGQGTKLIANYLNDNNIPTRKGDIWNNGSIQNMITNVVYMGKIRRGWSKTQKSIENGRVVRHIKRTKNMDEYQIYDGLHPALVSEETYMACQKIRLEKQPAPKTRASLDLMNPFAGLLFCAECGKTIERTKLSAKQGGQPRARCTNMRNCHNSTSAFELVETEIVEALKAWLVGYKIKLQTVGYADDIAANKKQIQKIDAEIKKLEGQLMNAYELVEQGIYSKDIFISRRSAIQSSITSAEEQRTSVEEILRRLEIAQNTQDSLIPQTERLLGAYDFMTNEERNALLKEIVQKIEYRKTRQGAIEIDLYPHLPKM